MDKIFASQVARSTPFDPEGTDLVSDNCQDAIEESLFKGVATPRFSIVTTHNGTISNNQWLGYSNLLPGDQVPIRIPVACNLREITFAYAALSVDGKFKLYKNGLLSGNIVLTVQFTNQDNFLIESNIDIPLVVGDFIVGRWIDEGSNPSDMAITYFPQAILP